MLSDIRSDYVTDAAPNSPERIKARDGRIVVWFTKWRLLGVFWAVQALVLYFGGAAWQVLAENVSENQKHYFGTIDVPDYARMVASWNFLQYSILTISGVTVLQWLLVAPVRKPRARRETGHSLWLSMAAAGAGIVGLATALVLSVGQGLDLAGVALPRWPERMLGGWGLLITWCLLCWIIATPLLTAFCRRRLRAGSHWEDVLYTISARLFMGTIIETAAIMPLDVLVRRKQSCYCWAGTYFALTICGAIGLVLVGPLIMLPALSRRRKRWYAGRCDCCGYDLSGLLDRGGPDRCPECGAGWRPGPAAQLAQPPAK